MSDDGERYLMTKELQFEFKKLGLPCSRNYINSLKTRGAPFIGNRARLAELIAWLKIAPLKKVKKSEFMCKKVKKG